MKKSCAIYHSRHDLFIYLGLTVMILIVFWPVASFDFVDYDDFHYILKNPHLKDGLSWEAIWWALTADLIAHSPNADYWIPMTFLSHLLAVELFGLNPAGHHLMNLALHVINTLLLFWVLRRTTGALWQSAFVAALFAIHPLHVESVAWVTERKDVLSTLFFMLTLIAYIRYTEQPGVGRYILIAVSFSLGLMAKPMLITLPMVLLLFDNWPLRRLTWAKGEVPHKVWNLTLEKIPLFLLTIVPIVTTYVAQQRGGALVSLENYPFWIRVGNAIVSYGSYIREMVWPFDLAVFYTHPGDTLSIWKPMGGAIFLGGVSVVVIRWREKFPYLFTGWFWYLGILAPVIGIVQTGFQGMADRYTYISLIGLFIMAVWGITDGVASLQYRKIFLATSGGFVLLALMVCAKIQVRYWQNTITLFEHAVEVSEENYLAQQNLGWALLKKWRFDEAIHHLTRSYELIANDHNVQRNFKNVDRYLIHFDQVIKGVKGILKLEEGSTEIHSRLGIIYYNFGHSEDAIQEFLMAIRLKPNDADVHNNLGIAYQSLGRSQDAARELQKTLTLRPNFPEAHRNLGIVYSKLGRPEHAIREFETAIRQKQNYVEAFNNLGVVQQERGELDEAIEAFNTALIYQPDNAKIHYNLAQAYRQKGKFKDAIKAYNRALEIRPNYAKAREGLMALSD